MRMRNALPALLLVILFILAACGSAAAAGGNAPGGAGAATVTMSALNFEPNNNKITIKAGQAITFSDPAATGGTHILVTGANGIFKGAGGAPTAFNTADGTQFNAGQTQIVTFATAGTYPITCTIHPFMEVTITVTP